MKTEHDLPRLPGGDGDKGALAQVQQFAMCPMRGAAHTGHQAHQDDAARGGASRAQEAACRAMYTGVGRFGGERSFGAIDSGAGGWTNGSRGDI